ncbi:MAG: hypothetical protein ACC619_07770, partial [Paracoccaceae bacterium]
MASNDVFSGMGALHMAWSAYELTLELLSRKILRLSFRNTHIVFGSLSFKAKQEITISLVKESDMANKDEIVQSIRRVSQLASRNHIFHSLLFSNVGGTKADFVKRETGNGL